MGAVELCFEVGVVSVGEIGIVMPPYAKEGVLADHLLVEADVPLVAGKRPQQVEQVGISFVALPA